AASVDGERPDSGDGNTVSDALNTQVFGPFEESLFISLDRPDGLETGTAEADAFGILTDDVLDFDLRVDIFNYPDSHGGSSWATSEITGSMPIVVTGEPVDYTLVMPFGFLFDLTIVGMHLQFALLDDNGTPVPIFAPGIGETYASFMQDGVQGNEFFNDDGEFPRDLVLTGTLQPGTYSFEFEGNVTGFGIGTVAMYGLVLSIPEPSGMLALAGLGALLVRRRAA